MNPYEAPAAPSALGAEKKFLYRANWVAGACLLLFASTFLIGKKVWATGIQVGPVVIWCTAALLVVRFPRQLGIVVGFLMLTSVYAQYYNFAQMISSFQVPPNPETSKEFWFRFWLSVAPLIVGVPFSIASTWSSHRPKPKDGEQRK